MPAEGQGARLTAAEQARAILARFEPALNNWGFDEVTEVINALAAENARLTAALETISGYANEDLSIYEMSSSCADAADQYWIGAIRVAREALTGRADGVE